jgi:hypothetical protein
LGVHIVSSDLKFSSLPLLGFRQQPFWVRRDEMRQLAGQDKHASPPVTPPESSFTHRHIKRKDVGHSTAAQRLDFENQMKAWLATGNTLMHVPVEVQRQSATDDAKFVCPPPPTTTTRVEAG